MRKKIYTYTISRYSPFNSAGIAYSEDSVGDGGEGTFLWELGHEEDVDVPLVQPLQALACGNDQPDPLTTGLARLVSSSSYRMEMLIKFSSFWRLNNNKLKIHLNFSWSFTYDIWCENNWKKVTLQLISSSFILRAKINQSRVTFRSWCQI
jgi:hypothetical protein